MAKGWTSIAIESDCSKIINILSDGSICFVSFGAILDACLSCKHLFTILNFSFAKRSDNSLAHTLAASFVSLDSKV